MDVLWHTLQTLKTPSFPGETEPLALGIAAIDSVLGGGLARGALHEFAVANETGLAAASGFVLGLTASLSAKMKRGILWIAEGMSLLESGAPYGPGIDDFGLAPERLVSVAGAQSRDVLWAMEEGLRCGGIGAVIAEVRGRGSIDLVAARRLSLAAGERGNLGLLLRTAHDPAPSAAVTRWIVEPAASAAQDVGTPRLSLHLVRNRRGSPGAWTVEWNRVERRFELASTRLESVVEPALDRPHRAAIAGA